MPQPPTAKVSSPVKGAKEVSELRDFIALQQQWQQQVCTLLTQLQPNGGIPLPAPPPPPAAVQASPEELEDEENKWARRRLDTAAKLQTWKGRLAEARDRQRRANRAMDDVHNHIAHFERKLKAVESRVDDDEWAKVAHFEPTKWDDDSVHGDPPDEDGMSVAGDSTSFQDLSQITPTTANTSVPFVQPTTNGFQSQMGSPFAQAEHAAQPSTDAMMAAAAEANARKQIIHEEGAKEQIPYDILEAAANQGHHWAYIKQCYETARLAFNYFDLTQQKPNLASFSQLSADIYEVQVNRHAAAIAQEIPQQTKVITSDDVAAEAGMN